MSDSANNAEDNVEATTPPDPRSGSDEGDIRAFDSYIASLRNAKIETPRIRPVDLVGAFVASLLALASVFAPWIRYVSLRLKVEYVPGYQTDGVFLIPCALVAMGSMVIAWRRGPGHGDIEALCAMVASIVGIITVVLTAMYLNGHSIADASGREEFRAGWGLYLGGISSSVAVFFAYRAMRSAQV